MSITDPNKKPTSEETIPWIFRVIFLVGIDQHGPLIATYCHFAASKLFMHAESHSVVSKIEK